jgi:hypothetical protein
MKTSIFDKIATVLAWVLVQTVIGIGCIHLMKMCTNDLAFIAVCIINFALCYFWSYKMSGEVKKAFGFTD